MLIGCRGPASASRSSAPSRPRPPASIVIAVGRRPPHDVGRVLAASPRARLRRRHFESGLEVGVELGHRRRHRPPPQKLRLEAADLVGARAGVVVWHVQGRSQRRRTQWRARASPNRTTASIEIGHVVFPGTRHAIRPNLYELAYSHFGIMLHSLTRTGEVAGARARYTIEISENVDALPGLELASHSSPKPGKSYSPGAGVLLPCLFRHVHK